jgi:NHLM bacteriocin system ABC transporter ATP-binding protein
MHTLELGIKHAITTGAQKLNPFSLDQADSFWLIESGSIDLFVMKQIDGEFVGAKHHVCRAVGNDFLLGSNCYFGDAGYAIQAVPTPDTLFYRIELKDLSVVALSMAIDSWVSLITRNTPREAPPKQYIPDETEFTLELVKGDVISTTRHFVWVKCIAGNLAFLGHRKLVINSHSPAFPLRQDTWLESLDDSIVESCSIENELHSGELQKIIVNYSRLIFLNFLYANIDAERKERIRLTLKTGITSSVMTQALDSFSAILKRNHRPHHSFEANDLLGACRLVGEKLSIQFKASKAFGKLPRDPVESIAHASNVRLRTVTLKGEWWLRNAGPMLVFYGEEKRPFALLNLPGNRYELRSANSAESIPVTPSVAEKIAPLAYVFYRVFSPEALHLPALIKFGIFGLKRDFLAVAMIGMTMGFIGMAVPILTGKLFDSVIPSASRSDLWQMTACLIAFALASSAFEFSRSVALLRIETRMDADIQAAIWDRVLKLPVDFFRKYSAGDLSARINGVNVIRQELSGVAISSILTGIFSCFNFALLFYYSVQLALLASVLVLVASVITLALGYLKLRYDRQLTEVTGRISGMVLQHLTGIAKLKVSGAETRAFANWAKDFSLQERLAFKSSTVQNVAETFFSVLPLLLSIFIFSAMANLMLKQQGVVMTTGEFIAFNSAFATFLYTSLQLSSTIFSVLNLIPVFERAKPILQTLPEADHSTVDPGELSGAIEVSNVSFFYTQDGPTILDNISITIAPGEFVAIVGPSGSGKSTLIRQLLGFEKPTSGAIYYDGKCLADLDLRAVRRQFGVVLQGGQLFTGEISTNIVGSSSLTPEDAWEAAKLCGLEDDILAMPMGIFTMVSEGGSTLSGGQRQRILIARAIVHRPRILIFDEATSALDNRTQSVISKSLEQLKATRIVIAHRLSTIINADRILVMHEGKIVQQGKYDDLLKAEGPFRKLALRQIA